jgi:hypothetical protein
LLSQCAFASTYERIYVRGMSETEAAYSNYAQPIVGYDFVSANPIRIDALGAYDHRTNGLEVPNVIGLWETASRTLVATATVGAGEINPFEGGYRWQSITPVFLNADVSYTIASWNSGYEAVGAHQRTALTVEPGITLGAGYVDTLYSGLQFPTRNGGPGVVFVGPGFAAVPEPSSLWLVALSPILWLVLKRLRSR